MSANLAQVFEELVRRMQEPLGLDRWQVKVVAGPDAENTASCSAMPEYLQATIAVDPDRLKTGDELDEIVAHELAHCHVWPIAHIADDMTILLGEIQAESAVLPVAKFLKAQVERAEEYATTQVGHTYVRLLRRLWALETEAKALRAELKQLKKVA